MKIYSSIYKRPEMSSILYKDMLASGLVAGYFPYQVPGMPNDKLLNVNVLGTPKDIYKFNPVLPRQYATAAGGDYETSEALLDPKTIPAYIPALYSIPDNTYPATQAVQASQAVLWVHDAENPFKLPTFEANTAVVTLNFSVRGLTGSIPTSIGNLTSLTSLFLYSNQLTGSIPTSIGNLTSLTFLYLDSNQLTGAIPTSIGNLTSLTNLYLYSNQLTGSIPTSIGNLTSLINLRLHSNQLTGAIPTEIGNLTSLIILYLYDNNFSKTDLSNFVTVLWTNRVVLGGNTCVINISNNNGLTADAIARIEGTGTYAADGIKDAGCTVTY